MCGKHFYIKLSLCISKIRRQESSRTRDTNEKDVKRSERRRSRSRETRRGDRIRSRSKDAKDRKEKRRSRSRSKDRKEERKERRRSRSDDRADRRRSRSRSEETRSKKRDQQAKMKITQKNIEDMENEAALKVAAEIKKTAAEEVEVRTCIVLIFVSQSLFLHFCFQFCAKIRCYFYISIYHL